MQLYTIGHSSHPIDELLRLLAGHGVTRLVDVRSTPYSRFHPQFNQSALRLSLEAAGIRYTYAGDSLGGRPKDPSCYQHHAIPTRAADFAAEIDYPAVMHKPWFQDGIVKLLDLASQQPTCILCSEKDPAHCHRHHLIAAYLLEHEPAWTIWHILSDGTLVNATSILR